MHIVNFKIFPIALNMHFFAENAQFWIRIARKKIQTQNWGIWGHNKYKLVMRDGTGHNKFIFKIPYSFFFFWVLFYFFFLPELIFFMSPKN